MSELSLESVTAYWHALRAAREPAVTPAMVGRMLGCVLNLAPNSAVGKIRRGDIGKILLSGFGRRPEILEDVLHLDFSVTGTAVRELPEILFGMDGDRVVGFFADDGKMVRRAPILEVLPLFDRRRAEHPEVVEWLESLLPA